MIFTAFIFAILCSVSFAAEGVFSYNSDSPAGPPSIWGTLPGFATCRTGRSQSPIDIPPSASQSSDTEISVKPSRGEYSFQGGSANFAFECDNSNCGRLKYRGETFELINIHFHSPSEHKIGGRSYPLEAHMVHRSSSGKLAVVGVLFQNGNGDRTLQTIFTLSAMKPDRTTLNLKRLISEEGEYYNYDGSLTTPPCSEGVKWFVSKRIRTVSGSQVSNYIRQIGTDGQGQGYGNNRPVQMLNGRTVSLVGDS